MIRATIFFAGITTLAALWLYAEWRTTDLRQWAAAPARAARWLLADLQWHRAARQAYAAGVDLMRTLAEPVGVELPPWRQAPTRGDRACPECGGHRCRPWREGRDCRHDGITNRAAYAAGRKLPLPGKHDSEVRIAHWVHIDRLHQLRDRMGIPAARVVRLP